MRNSDPAVAPRQAGVAENVHTEDVPSEGYVKVAHRNTAAQGPDGARMSDAAFRAWVALDRWAYKDECPTNAELAAACDWFNDAGEPAAWKAKRAFRELETLGIAKRIITRSDEGRHQREGIRVVRPQDPGALMSRGWGAGAPGGGALMSQGGGALAPPLLRSRCRKKREESEEDDDTATLDAVAPAEPPGPPACRSSSSTPSSQNWGGENSSPERQRPASPVAPASRTAMSGRAMAKIGEIPSGGEARRPLATLPPAPPRAAPPAPEAPPPDTPPLDLAALTEGQSECLERLTAEQRAAFDALPAERQREILEPHCMGYDRIIGAEDASKLRPKVPAAPPPPLPDTTAELWEGLPDAPGDWIQLAAEALARDFGTAKDRELWPEFSTLARAVWGGEFLAWKVLDALRQTMKPESENRGAVFCVALKRHGWRREAA